MADTMPQRERKMPIGRMILSNAIKSCHSEQSEESACLDREKKQISRAQAALGMTGLGISTSSKILCCEAEGFETVGAGPYALEPSK